MDDVERFHIFIILKRFPLSAIVKLYLYKQYMMSRFMRKPGFCLWDTKVQISAFDFAAWVVQFLSFSNLKLNFKLLAIVRAYIAWFDVEPVRKPHCLFSRVTAHMLLYFCWI